MLRRIVICLFSWLALAAPLFAQVPQNPRQAAFEPSPDHAIALRYEIGIFLLGAAQPAQVSSLGKPNPAGTPPTVTVQMPTIPLMGNYEVKVRAVGASAVAGVEVFSTWAMGGPKGDVPVPFDRVLLPPANLRAVP